MSRQFVLEEQAYQVITARSDRGRPARYPSKTTAGMLLLLVRDISRNLLGRCDGRGWQTRARCAYADGDAAAEGSKLERFDRGLRNQYHGLLKQGNVSHALCIMGTGAFHVNSRPVK